MCKIWSAYWAGLPDLPKKKKNRIFYDNKKEYGEERWIGLGLLRTIIAVVVYTELKNETILLISARKATKLERKYYEDKIKNEF